MTIRKKIGIALLAFMILSFTGCGQKGPLTLPQGELHGSLSLS